MPKLAIKKSKIHRMGIFAGIFIKKGETVFRFSNKSIRIGHKDGCDCKICRRSIQTSKSNWLWPDEKSYGWYLNHRCDPSCGIRGRDIVALRNIGPNEEITIDYSATTTDKKWKMKCSCKSSNCRKIIRSVQFLPDHVFKKYKGSMPKYVEKRY